MKTFWNHSYSHEGVISCSLALLEEIFRTPRIHTDFGYHRRDQLEEQRKRSRTLSGEYGNQNNRHDDVEDEEMAAKKQLEKLLAEKDSIENEIKEVKCILNDFESKREEERMREAQRIAENTRIFLEKMKREEEERIRLERIAEENKKKEVRRQRGECGWWVLKETDDFKENFTPFTSCVAVGDNGMHICLYDNGGYAYSSGLYNNLHKKLHSRASWHPSPDYVALGSNGRYYIRFTNGKSEWVGPNNLSTLLQQDNRRVKSVAFGEDWEDYFVVFEGGGYEYVGCPSGLEQKINARGKRGDLEKVTLGPNGEWSLWAKNGKAWWGGIGSGMKDSISDAGPDNITDLKFGSNGHYFIRYES
jgi:cell division protein FtsB